MSNHPLKSHFKFAPVCAAVLLAFNAHTVQANPLGGNVVSGQASFATNGNTLTVTNTPGTIINWQDFSIGQSEITRFAQQSASSTVLNRVVTNNPSQILGTLQSNGRVFLVNPNGILFGHGATVDVAGLVATTLNLSDADFLAGKNNFTAAPGAQAIKNEGNLNAQDGGEIWLIAPDVENPGIITAPNGDILLAAGHEVQILDSLTPNLRVNITAPAGNATNVGQLIVGAGKLGMFGTVVKNTGTASADSATMQGGKIVFKASQRVEAGGTISVSGVGGGRIDILADMENGTVAVSGTIQAAAPQSGDGGFIETSAAHVSIADSARINTMATNGNAGTWLIDPQDFTIGAISGDITGAALAAQLDSTNVIIQSTIGATAGNGDIFVNASVAKTGAAATTLTLQAVNNITVAPAVSISSTGGALDVVINSDSDGLNGGAIKMDASSSISSNGGNVILGGGIAGDGSGNASGNATYLTGIELLTGSSINAGGGNIVLNGAGYATGTGSLNMGVHLTGATLTTIGAGAITVNGTGGATSGTGSNRGVRFDTGSVLSTSSGAIFVSGQGGWDGDGVQVMGASSITSTFGNITLMGTSGTGVTADYGVNITASDAVSGNTVISSGGNIFIVGTSNNVTAGSNNRGTSISTRSIVETTGSGTLDVTGAGGFDSDGLTINSGALVRTADGAMTLSGVSGNGGADNYGAWISGVGTMVTSTGGGNISISGASTGMTGTGNAGLVVSADAQISSTGWGAINLSGAGSSEGDGLQILSGAIVQAASGGVALSGISGMGTGQDWGVWLSDTNTAVTSGGGLSIIGVSQSTSGADNVGIGIGGGAQLTTTAGMMTLIGTGGAGVDSEGVRLTGTLAVPVVNAAEGLNFSGPGVVWVDVDTLVNINGGSMQLSTTLTNNGEINLQPSTYIDINSGGTLNNAGILNFISNGYNCDEYYCYDGQASGVYVHTGGTLNNLAAGIINVSSNDYGWGYSYSFIDAASYGGSVTNAGTINVNSGQFDLSSNGQTHSGSFNTAAGANLYLYGTGIYSGAFTNAGATNLNGTNTLTATATGSFNQIGGVLQNSILSNGVILNFSGGTLQDSTVQAGSTVNWTGGTMAGLVTLNAAGANPAAALNINGGTVYLDGTLNNSGAITFQPNAYLNINNGGTLNNASALNFNSNGYNCDEYNCYDGQTSGIYVNTGGTLNNLAAGIINVSSNDYGWGYSYSFIDAANYGGSVTNAGTLNVNGGTFDFVGDGQIYGGNFNTAAGAGLNLYGTGTYSGTFSSAGATYFNGSNTLGGASGTGNFYLVGGTLTGDINGLSDTLNITGGILIGASINAGHTINFSGGTLQDSTAQAGSTVNWTGGSINGVNTLNTGAVLNIGGYGATNLNGTLNNAGDINVAAGSSTHINTGGTLNNASVLNFNSNGYNCDEYNCYDGQASGIYVNTGGTLNNLAAGIINVSSNDYGWGYSYSFIDAANYGGSVTNAGTINVNGGVLHLDTQSNTGSIVLQSGGLDLGGAFSAASFNAIVRSAGTSVSFRGSLDNNGGTLDIGSAGLFGLGGLNVLSGTIMGGTLVNTDVTPMLTGNGGSLDGVTLGSNLSLGGGLNVYNNLVLANGVTLDFGNNYLSFNTSFAQGITTPGVATINMAGGYLYQNSVEQNLTLGSGLTINGWGSIGNGNSGNGLTNNATINANTDGQTLYIGASGNNFTNNGMLNLSAGGLVLYGNHTAAGLSSDFGALHFTRAAGTTLEYGGSLDNTAATLDIGSAGLFGTGGLNMLSGTILNGTLINSDVVPVLLSSGGGTLDGVTVGSNLAISGDLDIYNNLVLANGVTLDIGASPLYFMTTGAQNISTPGAATIIMAGGKLWQYTNNQTLALGAGLTVNGYGEIGNYNYNNYYYYYGWDVPYSGNTLVNNGIINANTDGQTLTLGRFSNYSNTGTVNLTAGTLNLDGVFTVAGFGIFNRTGGTSVYLNGGLDNTGATVDVGSAGIFGAGGLTALNGTILGGTLINTDAAPALVTGANPLWRNSGALYDNPYATLDGVTIGSNLALNSGGNPVLVNNNLLLANGITLDLGTTSLLFQTMGAQSISTAGTATINLAGGGIYQDSSSQMLTLGTGLTINGWGGLASSGWYNTPYSNSLINDATINANTAGQTLTIGYGNADYQNTFTNNGMLNLSAGGLVLNGNHTTASLSSDLGVLHFTRAASTTVDFYGTLDNTLATVDIGNAGTFGAGGLSNLGGTIINGTLINSDVVAPTLKSYWGTLDNVTIGSNLSLADVTVDGSPTASNLNITNNLTLADGVVLDIGASGLYFNTAGVQSLSVAAGTASINMAGGTLRQNTDNQTLTLGAGLTVNGWGDIGNTATYYWGGPNFYGNHLVNNGIINANTAGQTLTLAKWDDTFTNNGSVNLTLGNLDLWSNYTTAGLEANFGIDHFSSSVGTQLYFSGTLDNTGGTLDIGGGGIFAAGGLSELRGSITGGMIISGDGTTLTSVGGTLNGVTLGSNFNVVGDLVIDNGLTLDNGMVVSKDASNWYFRGDGVQHLATTGTATLTMNGGNLFTGYQSGAQTFQIDSGVTVQGYGAVMSCGQYCNTANFINNGTILANVAGQTLNLATPDFNTQGDFTNNGTISVTAGTLNIGGDIYGSLSSFTNTGTLNAGTGTTLTIVTPVLNNSGTITLDGDSHVLGSVWWSEIGPQFATLNNSGNINFSNGTLLLQITDTTAGLNANLGGVHFTRNGGTLEYAGIIDNTNDTLNIGSGGIFGAGGLNTLSGMISGGNLIGWSGTHAMAVNGSLLDGVTISNNLSLVGSGILDIDNGLTLANGVTLNAGANTLYIYGTSVGINTPGNATLTLGSGALYQMTQNQVLTLASGMTVNGYGVLGADYYAYGTATLINNGIVDASVAGQAINFNGFIYELSDTLINNGTLRASAGDMNVGYGAFTNNGLVDGTTGTYITLNTGGTHSGSFNLASGATLIFDGGATHHLTHVTSITGNGNLDLSTNGGVVNIDGSVSANTITNQGYSTSTINGAVTANNLWIDSGSLVLNGSVSPLTALTMNGGALNLAGGLTVGTLGLYDGTGTPEITGVGTLTVSDAFYLHGVTLNTNGLNIINNGAMDGMGSLGIYGGNFTNNGTIHLGGAGAAGSLNITGDVSLGNTSILNIDFDTPLQGQSDAFNVTGNVVLGGTINATQSVAYTPVVNDAIPFITMTGTASGTFATSNLPLGFVSGYNLAAGEAARLIYAMNNLMFTNAAGGMDWSVANNWSSGVLPGITDIAFISAGHAVVHSSGNDTVAGLSISGGNSLDVSGGSLTVLGDTTLDGDLMVSGVGDTVLKGLVGGGGTGQVIVSGGTLTMLSDVSVNNFTFSGGTVNAPAFLNVSNNYTQSGGTLVTPASLDLSSGNNISVTGGSINSTNSAVTMSAFNTIAVNVNFSASKFVLAGGTWTQVGVLPTFSANDFSIFGGTFIRALGGDGSALSPYQLTDIYGVQGVGSMGMTGNSYVLANDIDATGTANWDGGNGFTPIHGEIGFTGQFDGQGHTINGLFINHFETSNVGLFGKIGNTGSVTQVGLTGVDISSGNNVGALAGSNYGQISNVFVEGGWVKANYGMAGGLVGNNYGTIDSSYTSAVGVWASGRAGGLVGENNSIISNAYSVGGTVAGGGDWGGLVGANWATITNTYSNNEVAYGGGGLTGVDEMGYANIGYWDVELSGAQTSGGSEVGLTSAEMKNLASFVGWDIANTGGAGATWRIYENQTAPMLTAFLTPLTVTANNLSFTYDSYAYEGGNGVSYSITPSGLLGTINYSGSSQSAQNVGTYGIGVSGLYSGQHGYDISFVSGTLTITPAILTYVANPFSRNQGDHNPAFSGSVTGLVGNETLDIATDGQAVFSSSANENSEPGSYLVEGSGLTANNGNYVFAQAASNNSALIINPASSHEGDHDVENIIHTVTQTPDVDFEGGHDMGDIGGDVGGHDNTVVADGGQGGEGEQDDDKEKDADKVNGNEAPPEDSHSMELNNLPVCR